MLHESEEGRPMTLGERCDGIVRLIDETLVAVAGDRRDDVDGPSDPDQRRWGPAPAASVVHRRRWHGGNVRL
jgi:hypothetical protein